MRFNELNSLIRLFERIVTLHKYVLSVIDGRHIPHLVSIGNRTFSLEP